MIRDEIRKHLIAKGYTQKSFCDEAYIAPMTLSRFLRDEGNTSFATVERIAETLGCEIILIPKEKAGQPRIDLEDDFFGAILNCAVRYSIGRMSYMPGLVIDFIRPLLPYLNNKTLNNLERDIRTAGSHGDEKIDKPGWMRFLQQIQEEQRNREVTQCRTK